MAEFCRIIWLTFLCLLGIGACGIVVVGTGTVLAAFIVQMINSNKEE